MATLARSDGRPAILVGSPAPTPTVRTTDGGAVRVADLWHNAPRALVLVFFRHFG